MSGSGCCSSACVQYLGLTGACAACSHCARPRHGSCQAMIALMRRPLSSACHARFMCSAPAFYAWRRLPLICLTLLVGVYVRDGLVASVCVCRTSAASVQFLPRGSRAVAFPRWLHVLSCLTWLIVRCCIGGLCFGSICADTVLHPLSCVLGLLRRCLCCRATGAIPALPP